MTHSSFRAAFSLAAALLFVPAASAHVTLEAAMVEPGKTIRHVLRVPHGCGHQATQAVRVTIPQGVHSVKPMPKSGWTLSVTKAAYGKPIQSGDSALTEGVTEILWSGGNLSDDFYDEFVFRAVVAADAKPGTVIAFPTVQDCGSAKAAWTEIPAQGQDAHALKSPAPSVTVAQAKAAAGQGGSTDHAAHGAAAATQASALVIETPWIRATPGGAKVGGGYLKITNTGKEPDRLIGGSLAQAGRLEVHEMAVTNGIMTMRPLDKGLEIKPGESVELKPGGYHLMFLDLTAPIAAGAPVKGTLVFEKAGTVAVEYQVAPVGAPGPAADPHKHH